MFIFASWWPIIALLFLSMNGDEPKAMETIAVCGLQLQSEIGRRGGELWLAMSCGRTAGSTL
jgi:hypothetical protein